MSITQKQSSEDVQPPKQTTPVSDTLEGAGLSDSMQETQPTEEATVSKLYAKDTYLRYVEKLGKMDGEVEGLVGQIQDESVAKEMAALRDEVIQPQLSKPVDEDATEREYLLALNELTAAWRILTNRMLPLVTKLKEAGETELKEDVQKQQRIALEVATGLEMVSARIAQEQATGSLGARQFEVAEDMRTALLGAPMVQKT